VVHLRRACEWRRIPPGILALGGGLPTNFEVVIRDPELGSFALHEEFLLEVLEGKEDNTLWRHVSLLELKDAISKEARMMDSDCGWHTSPGSSPTHDPPRPSHRRIDRVHAALLQARIRYQIVGGLDSRGRSWGHLTLVVGSLLGGGVCLRRAGFLESPESKYILIDSRTGWKVRLLEGRPRRSR
jgi:hypothetical protein